MSRRNNPAGETRQRRRRLTLLWSAIVVAIVIGLIWKEQIALLYVLATLSVTALLVVVAVSDLRGARVAGTETPPMDDAAAIADGTATARRC
ncbi:MAG: hypothetical protein H0T63_00690 [Pyrinomonadaceae bacterium]|nr:hypothetical protein [Pyrinomonadaceae bacterium]